MKLATFDIWDTCLTRRQSEPKHVFSEVALRLSGGQSFEDPAAAELAAQRIRAEAAARDEAPNRECNFSEIKLVMERLMGARQAEAFGTHELELEIASARPVESMRIMVLQARARGEQIAFISDMYLPVEFLHQLLMQHGFAESGDRVFVSSDRRANKRSGELFDLVARELGGVPAQWKHIGDKLDADVRAPASLGINASHFSAVKLTPSEQRAGEGAAASARTSSRLVGGMRAVRLGLSFPAERAGLLANVIAPWLCALAARMVRDAEAQGLKRLYFMSRDGEILLRIARRIAPSSLGCRYLYSSRRAWCFPAMVADDSSSRRWLETFAVSPRGILNSLEFTADETAGILNELKLSEAASRQRAIPEERVFVWDHLRRTGRMDRVLERASAAREPCLAYLEQEGLLQDSDWAVCDVGWVLNGQAALTRLLQCRDPRTVARGFYFMVNRRRPPLAETGPFSSWLLDEALPSGPGSIPQTVTWLSGLIEEVFFTSSDPSLQSYRLDTASGRTGPVFGPRQEDECIICHAKELRETVDQLTNEWMDELRDPRFVESLSHYSLAELLRFLRTPSREEASVIATLHHTSEATNAKYDAGLLAREWRVGDALQVLGRRSRLLDPRSVREPLWTAGCDALTLPVNRWIRKLVLTPLRRPH